MAVGASRICKWRIKMRMRVPSGAPSRRASRGSRSSRPPSCPSRSAPPAAPLLRASVRGSLLCRVKCAGDCWVGFTFTRRCFSHTQYICAMRSTKEHEKKGERTGLAFAEHLVEAVRPDVLLLLRAAARLCCRLGNQALCCNIGNRTRVIKMPIINKRIKLKPIVSLEFLFVIWSPFHSLNKTRSFLLSTYSTSIQTLYPVTCIQKSIYYLSCRI